MNEIIAKKIGEVKAFCLLWQETYAEIGLTAYEKVVGAKTISKLEETNSQFIVAIDSVASETGVSQSYAVLINQKAEATANKLRTMRDIYLNDNWHDPIELMEWTGFFAGGAVVHWTLVRALSEKLANSDLADTARTATEFFNDRLIEASQALTDLQD